MTVGKRVNDHVDTLGEKKTKVSKITDFFKSARTTTETDEILESEHVKEGSVDLERTNGVKIITETETGDSHFKEEFIKKLTEEQRELLQLEIDTLEDSWFEQLHKEFTKPYFIQLKKFLKTQWANKIQVLPPKDDIYSWSRLTPLHRVKIIILGQDPYHNVNQAHGLAFSVKSPTPPPPSLKNIYKALKIDYPDFEIPKGKGDLTRWAEQGVLMLNVCLTVKAHEANSHAKKGWEQFTETVLKVALQNTTEKKVVLLWGTPAQKRFESLKLKVDSNDLLVLKSVHPSPLSAGRGFFDCGHFKKSNKWLTERGVEPVNWGLL